MISSMFSVAGVYCCFADVHALSIYPKLFNILLADIFEGYALFVCTADNLIVDICKVLYKINLVTSVFKVTAHYVKNAERSCVTDMDEVINCGTASVDFELAGGLGYKLLFVS